MLLSVIIPMYNAENYIRRCVESLYQQNIIDSDFEVIIINDGSIDQSYQQACILSKEHANIILIDKEKTTLTASFASPAPTFQRSSPLMRTAS